VGNHRVVFLSHIAERPPRAGTGPAPTIAVLFNIAECGKSSCGFFIPYRRTPTTGRHGAGPYNSGVVQYRRMRKIIVWFFLSHIAERPPFMKFPLVLV
jgi:hypothetical protein